MNDMIWVENVSEHLIKLKLITEYVDYKEHTYSGNNYEQRIEIFNYFGTFLQKEYGLAITLPGTSNYEVIYNECIGEEKVEVDIELSSEELKYYDVYANYPTEIISIPLYKTEIHVTCKVNRVKENEVATCPKCKSVNSVTKQRTNNGRQLFKCKKCPKIFYNEKKIALLENTKIPFTKWVAFIIMNTHRICVRNKREHDCEMNVCTLKGIANKIGLHKSTITRMERNFKTNNEYATFNLSIPHLGAYLKSHDSYLIEDSN